MISSNDFKAIAELDLEPIKAKLMHKESGEAWSPEKANAVETQYRRFLYLMKMFPTEQTAPLVDVDTFWHYHILDTMKYAQDCEKAFGYFLHHYPYLGLGEQDDVQVQQRAGQRMQELYEQTFGESYAEAANGAWCGRTVEGDGSAWCGRTVEASASAWCGRTVEPAKSAWCGRTVEASATAWCGRTVEPAKSAWCGRTVEPAKAAWCGRTVEPAKTAWCGRTVEPAAHAWCGRTVEASGAALDYTPKSVAYPALAAPLPLAA